MADAWRELARTVPENLADACVSEEAVGLIDLAVTNLQAKADLLRTIRNGANLEDAAEGHVEPDPVGVCPTAVLEDVRREIKRCSSLHGLATRAAPLCVEHLRLEPDEQMRQVWESYNDTALNNAAGAQMRLRKAATASKAAVDAISLAGVLLVGCPLFLAWMRAAEQLTNQAINEVTLALGNVQEMRYATFLQFLLVWRILQLD